jgi:hypothetical protein
VLAVLLASSVIGLCWRVTSSSRVTVQVPLFQHMDDLVLENICDRVKSLIFPKGEIVSTFP